MKTYKILLLMSILTGLMACDNNGLDFSGFPSVVISNATVEMKLYTPDPETGMYRATRFDWSGVIESVVYEGHEYFGYWKNTHDPLYHEDLAGPVEGYIEPGLGYAEAVPGEGFIRIGVGVIEKKDEAEYDWAGVYKILDHGTWNTEHGEDWITFIHKVSSDLGYGYVYKKTIRLKEDGFTIEHRLLNTGTKAIETDQFNHNFFMIDGEPSGPAFKITFPYEISTEDDPKGYYNLEGNSLTYLKNIDQGVLVKMKEFSKELEDHHVTVLNQKSGAGVTFSVNKPLYDMAFWSCPTTLCPENFIWLSVRPGQEESWTSEYTLFVEEHL
jgi:hypothetical protein